MRLIRQIRPIRLILFFLSALLVAGALVFIFSYFSKPASASWFDESWLYRQAITVTVSSSSSDISNLETLITVANTNTLVTNGKLQSSCQDLRFTSTSGKLLPYYIDSGCNSASTKIWVEADLVPKNTTTYTMYMYYGNATATSKSDSVKFNLYNGLQGYWNMNEASGNLGDVSGNSNTGTATSTSVVTGKYGNGRSFNGSTSNVGLASETTDSTGSLSVWINTSANGNNEIYSQGTSSGLDTSRIQFGVYSGKVSLLVQVNSVVVLNVTTDSTFNNGSWHLVTWVIGSSSNKIYVDGTQQAVTYTTGDSTTQKWFSDVSGQTNTQEFGRLRISGTSYNWFNGTLDDARIYNRALSAVDVTRLYNDSTSSILTAGSGPASTSFASEEQGPGPVAYWKFDDGQGQTAQDSSSSNNDGTLGATSGSSTDDPTWTTEDQCVSGKCLKFDGSADWVSGGTTDTLNLSAAFTLSAWVRRSSTGRYDGIIQRYGGAPNYSGYGLRFDNADKVCFWVGHASGTWLCTTATVTDSKWHSISATWNGANRSIYVDGIQKANDTPANYSLSNSGDTLSIGAFDGGTDSLLWGFMDDVKIYPYARSAAQVKSDYLAGKANAGTKQGIAAVLGSKPEDWLSNGLVGYWKMDEAASPSIDSSGNGLSGTWNGNTAAAVGKFGSGVTLDGTGDFISIANNSALNTASGTVAAWVYYNALASNSTVVSKWVNDPYGYRIYSDVNGSVTFQIGDGSGADSAASANTTVTTGSWYHLVGIWRAGQGVQLFVNGSLNVNTVGTRTISYSGTPSALNIGRNVAEWDLNGRIDEVRTYNRALSPKEVSDLYNFAPGPVGYWNFEEASGNANDISGNGNTGTATGTTVTQGKYGKARSFTTTSDKVATSNVVSTATSNFTLEAWVKWSGNTGSNQLIAYNGNSGTSGWGIYLASSDSNQIHLLYGGVIDVDTNTTLTAGSWTHLVMKRDATTLYGFLNGSQFYSGNTNTPNAPSGVTNIGNESTIYFKGVIDEVKVYNYARTQKQIVSDMNAGHPAVGSPVGSAVGYWKFDEGADNKCSGGTNDVCNSGSGGSTLDGAESGMAVPATSTSGWTNSGKFGKALLFDGTNDYVSVSNNSALQLSSQGTLSAWINLASSPNAWAVVVAKRTAGSASGYEYELDLSSSGTSLRGLISNGSSNGIVSGSTVLSSGTWYHAVFVWDGSNLKLYLNGKLEATTSQTFNAQTSTNPLEIGRANDPSPIYFKGTIDEPKIYNYALTSDEVKTEYNRGSSLVLGAAGTNSSYQSQAANQEYCIPGDSTSCAAPVGEWKFEERTGTSAYDTSGNGFTGTLGGDGAGTDLPTWKPGKIGGALSFDGSDDFVQVTDNNTLDLTSTSLTLEAWVKPNNLPTSGNLMSILEKYLSTDPWGGWDFRLYNNSGTQQLDFTYYDTTTTNRTTTYTGSLSTTQWSHIVAVHNASADTDTIYLNGAQVAQNTGRTLEIKGSTKDFTIGNFGTLSRYFNGKIDQVRIFNYARSAAQIAWDYNRGKPVGHWKMDECQGTTINDSSGNSNRGTWNGTGGGTQTSVGTCTGSANTAWKDGATGKRNSSLDFDGTDDYVNLGNTSSLNAGGLTEWSISTWFKPSTSTCSTHNNDEIITKWNSGYQYLLGYKNDNTCTITYAVRTGGTGAGGASKLVYSSTPVSDTSRWYHLAGVYNGSTLKLYIDGVENNSAAATGSINTGVSDNVIIGSYADLFAGQFITGAVDDLRIYNYALTATQIKDIMNEGAVRFGPSTGSP